MTLTIRDPGSAITHFIGWIMALCAVFPLFIKAAGNSCLASMLVFGLSMVELYAASTTYHTINVQSGRIFTLFKRIDHLSIFLLIAGTYTPICTIVLKGRTGTILLTAIWSMAALGMITKYFFVNCPKWFSSILYIAMGWMCVFTFKPLINLLPGGAFSWLLGGGIFYTLGGALYGFKLKAFNARHPKFGSHEIFHLFIMAGSACHFIFMYVYVVSM